MRVKRLSVIVMHTAMILLCLVLFTAHLSSGMFARYTTATSDSDEARAAKYNVEITPVGSDNFTIENQTEGGNRYGTAAYTFKVTNNSEVPVRCSLAVALKVDSAAVSAYDFDADSKSDIYERMVQNVKMNGVAGTRGTDNKYTFAGLTDTPITLEIGQSETYTLTMDTDVVARYATSGTGAHWDDNEGWDFEMIPVKFDITAKTVQID